MTDRKRVFAAAAVASALALVLSRVPWLIVEQLVDRLQAGEPVWVPTFGTVGRTVTVYDSAVAIAAGVLLLAPGFLLGYAVLDRRDVRGDFRQFVVTLVAGSTGGVLFTGAVALLLVWIVGGGPASFARVSTWTLTVVVLGLGRGFVEVALVVTVTALAGVAVATFDTGSRPPADGAIEPNGSPAPSVRDD